MGKKTDKLDRLIASLRDERWDDPDAKRLVITGVQLAKASITANRKTDKAKLFGSPAVPSNTALDGRHWSAWPIRPLSSD